MPPPQAYAGPTNFSEMPQPLQASGEDLAGFPPTLIHAGNNEVVIDDARGFADLLRGHNVDVNLREFNRVIHGWHSFFPVMPQATARPSPPSPSSIRFDR